MELTNHYKTLTYDGHAVSEIFINIKYYKYY